MLLKVHIVTEFLSKQRNYRWKKQNEEADVNCTAEQDTYDDEVNSYSELYDSDYQVSWDTDG